MTVQPAASRLAEAEKLVADLVRAVAPAAVATELLPARKLQPQPCTDAQAGLVYYTFDRQFEAGGGVTGASLVPAIESQLQSRGFSTHDPGSTGGWSTRTARNGQLGIDILGAPAAGTVRIGVDTQCGTP